MQFADPAILFDGAAHAHQAHHVERQQRPIEVQWPPSGVFLLESHHRDDFRMEWRADPFDKVLYTLNGAGMLETPGASGRKLAAPAIACIPRHTRHRIRDVRGAPLSLYGMCLHPRAFAFGELAADACSQLWSRTGLPAAVETTARLRRLIREQALPRERSREAIAALACELLVELVRSRNTATPPLSARDRVAAYSHAMQDAFFEKDTLEAAAARTGLSQRRFSDLFRQLNGTSWQRRVNDLRIQHACSMLASGHYAIKSVAFTCGFDDLAHFYRVFKERQGVTPGQYASNASTRAARTHPRKPSRKSQ